jgi:hypothetical protein
MREVRFTTKFDFGDIVTLKAFSSTERRQRFAVVCAMFFLNSDNPGAGEIAYGCRAMVGAAWSPEQRIATGPTLGLGLYEFFESELVQWEDRRRDTL